jgi:hypothetical protein
LVFVVSIATPLLLAQAYFRLSQLIAT